MNNSTPDQNNQATTQTASPSPNTLQTQVTYSVGLLAVPAKGIITYDGVGTIQLIDATTNTAVFTKTIQELSKVTRAEYALYMTIPGMKKVTVMFGNAKQYVTKNAATLPLGISGAVGGIVMSNEMNRQSGLEDWVALFKANGKIRNLSPNSLVVIAAVLGVVIVGISMLVYAFM